LLWGVGGTVLSALGFVALALFEQYNGMLSELRNDLKHFNETSSDYVKKETLHKMREQVVECYKELHASIAARTQAEQELRSSEKARTEMASELQRMRERLAFLEGRVTATPSAGPSGD
jgi:chromosome segregation ATPase